MYRPKDQSFISKGHTSEYWCGTVAYSVDYECLAYLDIGEEGCYDEDGEPVEGSSIRGIMFNPDGHAVDVDLELDHYDDIYDHFHPWFPSTFYFTSDYGDGLFVMNKFQNYKRSASNELYYGCTPYLRSDGRLASNGHSVSLSSVAKWKTVNRTLEEAINRLSECSVAALNKDYAILSTPGLDDYFAMLMFRETPIGMMGYNYRIMLHPKYLSHFQGVAEALSKGGTIDAT